jgi:hypothetical protein
MTRGSCLDLEKATKVNEEVVDQYKLWIRMFRNFSCEMGIFNLEFIQTDVLLAYPSSTPLIITLEAG